MNITDISQFATEERKYLQRKYPDLYNDLEKCTYAQATKLGEEAGELNEALLAHFGRQRQSKASKKTNIAEEMADVIMVTMLMAAGLNIDIERAIEQKIATVKSRRTVET
jgi:NTP pyrophosphatase (non-canonical NTP hydrolase)